MGKVIVMVGVSGTGKSTHASKLTQENWGNVRVLSTDNYYMRDGQYVYDPSKISEAHAWCFREFLGALSDQVGLVIIDNTSLTQREISPYALGAAAFGYELEIVILRSRNPRIGSRNTHGVPVAEQQNQLKRLENLQLVPWWPHSEIWVD
jgi:predicted kinase